MERSLTRADGSWTQIGGTITDTFYEDKGLDSDKTYYYRVYAVNKDSTCSTTAATSPAITTLKDSTPLTVPDNLCYIGKTSTTVSLTWDAVGKATSYEIQYSTGSGSWSTDNVAISGTTAFVSGLTNGTEYKFQVRAMSSTGQSDSDWSVSLSMTTDIVETKPEPPKNLRRTGKTSTAVLLAWDSVSNATSYDIRYQSDGTSWSLINRIVAHCRYPLAYSDNGGIDGNAKGLPHRNAVLDSLIRFSLLTALGFNVIGNAPVTWSIGRFCCAPNSRLSQQTTCE